MPGPWKQRFRRGPREREAAGFSIICAPGRKKLIAEKTAKSRGCQKIVIETRRKDRYAVFCQDTWQTVTIEEFGGKAMAHMLAAPRRTKWTALAAYMKRYWPLYVFLIPAVLDVLIFKYLPMYGLQIGFRDFKIRKGIWGSDWVGLKYFIKFVKSPNFWPLLKNTLSISLNSLIWGFPVPILLALMINEIRQPRYKRVVQTITYAPHFLSLVAVVGLIKMLLALDSGLFNNIRAGLGLERLNYMAMSNAYQPIYILSGIWQNMGWSSIIYLAALSSIDVEMLEAAQIDGVNRFQKIWYLDLPTILPTIIILLIMRAGSLLSVGHEKVLLLQNDLIKDVSEVISTYTYNIGILQAQYSYTTAIGLFNSVANGLILILVNQISRRVSSTSLW